MRDLYIWDNKRFLMIIEYIKQTKFYFNLTRLVFSIALLIIYPNLVYPSILWLLSNLNNPFNE